MLKLKTLPCFVSLMLICLFAQSVEAQTFNRLTRYWKFGLIGSLVASEKTEFFNIDADNVESITESRNFYGIFAERIYFDEFGFGFSLLKGDYSSEFNVNTDANSILKGKTSAYQGNFNFVAYLNKNRRTGILFAFEASLGYYYMQTKLTSDSFYYNDAVSGQTATIADFSEDINAGFISSAFLVKMDLRFTGSGIRLSAGIITGGTFEKVKFNVPNFENQGVIGLRTSLKNSPVVTLEVYSFD